jgi:hypothetical protein
MAAGADLQLAIPSTCAPDGLHTNRSSVSRPAPLKARLYFGCLEHVDGGELHPSASACAFTIRKQPCYWASLFTAAEATEQGRYLMAIKG